MKRTIKEYLQSILLAVLLALLIRTFVVQAFLIPSGSMEPTLLVGDHILVNKFIFGIRIPFTDLHFSAIEKPKRGDVIVFIYPKDPSVDFIKRVIGTEGDKVQIIDRNIYINDIMINDPWGHFIDGWLPVFLSRIENYGPVIVPASSLFVMGDNRDNSEDSRFWGFVPMKNVIGKAVIIYYSWDSEAVDIRDKIRWSRFGKPVR